jgi:uncharacterized membrane protein YidH (DUF202 family)
VRGAAGERTGLAWERCALGPLTAAALLLVRDVGPTLARLLLVSTDVLLALAVIWFGRRRDGRIAALRGDASGKITVAASGREVVGAAVGATAIAVGTAVFIVVGT